MDKKDTVIGQVPEKFNRRRIPKVPLLIVALLVGTIGGYVLVKSFADTPNSNCFSAPNRCGYPDSTNTGVPVGTSLAPSGSITVSTPGTTIDSKDVTGTIEVAANNVTIQNSRVTLNFNHPIDKNCTDVTQVTCGNYEIIIDDGVTGTVIKNSELRISSNNIYCEHDIRNLGKDVTIIGDYLHGCDSNLFSASSASITDTYGIANQGTATEHIATDHIENVYLNDSKLTVDHSTLFNPVDQTAVIFADSNGGSHGGACSNQITVKNSLLAGGGYTIYPCGNAGSAGSSKISITDNHFARCLTAETNASGGSHPCSGGPDSNGYYPGSGAFGIAAYYFSNQTWSGNVWDNDLQAVCADGNDGCGDNGNPVTSPPDTSPPTVSMTAPQNGNTVSGSSVPVSATASDDTGVVGVQFQLDGNNIGKEDTSSPYSIKWDTTSVTNSSHTLTAIARDAAGNTTPSSVTVTVDNTAVGGGGGGGGTGGAGCTVSATTTTFASVFKSASGGDVICLAAGKYGTFNGALKSGMVTIRPQDGVTAKQVTMTINFNPASNITIDGVTVLTDSLIGNSQTKHITIKNSDFPGQITLNASELANADILFDHNVHHDFNATDNREGRIFVPNPNDSTTPVGVTIQNSQFVNGNSDGIQNGADGLQIIGNDFSGIVQVNNSNVHADSIQLLGSKDTLIKDNYFHNVEDGIMCADGCNHEVIENNVFAITNSPFAITLLSDNGSSITHNTFPDAACSFSQRCGKIMVGNKSGDAASKGTTLNDNILNSTADSNGNPSVAGLAHEDYNLFAGQQKNTGSHDITGKPTYSGGTNPSTYADYALAAGSLGIGNASDGKNRGINLTDVGSGGSGGGGGNPTPPPDTEKPTVNFTAPTANESVSDIETATADAHDNIGVTKVEFYLDGSLKMPDTEAPYNYSFDSKTLTNGTHSLSAKAYDAAGNIGTATVTFTVNNPDKTPPSVPTNVNVNPTSATNVNISWDASTDSGPNATGVAKYNVVRGDTVIATVVGTSYADTTAVANTKYSYAVQAVDGAGNTSDNSAVVNVTTPAGSSPSTDLLFNGTKINQFLNQSAPGAVTQVSDPLGSGQQVFQFTVKNSDVAPVTPTENPRAQLVGPDDINIGDEVWVENKFLLPNDFPSNVPGWLALFATYGPPFAGSGPWGIEVSGNQIQWQRNDTYRYDIPWSVPIAKNQWTTILLHEKLDANGYIEMWVNGQPVTFFAKNMTNYYNPNNVAPTTHLNMQTADHTNNGGANSGRVAQYRKVNMFDTVTTYHGPLVIGKTRAAVDAAWTADGGQNPPTPPTSPDKTSPTVPTGLAAKTVNANQVNVTWNPSTDEGGSGIAGYYVYRNDTKLNQTPVTTPSYGDSTLQPNTTYTYKVQAVDGAGNISAESDAISVTTSKSPDTTKPGKPKRVRVKAVSANEVTVKWRASTDSGGSKVAGYNIYRNGTQANQNLITGTSYDDKTVTSSTTYHYKIEAVDGAGNKSDKTSSVSVTTPKSKTSSNAGGSNTLTSTGQSGSSSSSTPAAVAITVLGSNHKTVAGATVVINGQTAKTDGQGVAHFSNVRSGNYNVAVSYNGKHVSQPVQVAKNTSQSSPQAIQVKLASDKFNPALILVPVAVLMIAGVYFTRPWERLAEASIGEAADHVVTSDRTIVSTSTDPAPGHPHHQAPGTVFSPHDTSKSNKRD